MQLYRGDHFTRIANSAMPNKMNFTLGCVILFLFASQAVAQGKHMKRILFAYNIGYCLHPHTKCLFISSRRGGSAVEQCLCPWLLIYKHMHAFSAVR